MGENREQEDPHDRVLFRQLLETISTNPRHDLDAKFFPRQNFAGSYLPLKYVMADKIIENFSKQKLDINNFYIKVNTQILDKRKRFCIGLGSDRKCIESRDRMKEWVHGFSPKPDRFHVMYQTGLHQTFGSIQKVLDRKQGQFGIEFEMRLTLTEDRGKIMASDLSRNKIGQTQPL